MPVTPLLRISYQNLQLQLYNGEQAETESGHNDDIRKADVLEGSDLPTLS